MAVKVVIVTPRMLNPRTVGGVEGLESTGTRRKPHINCPADGAVNVEVATINPLLAVPTEWTGLLGEKAT